MSPARQASVAAATARPRPAAPPLTLDDPIRFLSGVGPRRAEAFEKLGVRRIRDLLEYVPLRHERLVPSTIEHVELGQMVTIVGRVTNLRDVGWGRNRRVVANVTDNTARCSVCWFNAGYMVDKLRPGSIVKLTGKVGEFQNLPQLVNPAVAVLDDGASPIDEAAPIEWRPIYPAGAGLSSPQIAAVVRRHVPDFAAQAPEWLDEPERRSRRLADRREALLRIHAPRSEAEAAAARRRLAYDEFLFLQLAGRLARRAHDLGPAAMSLACGPTIDQRIRRRLPFPPTAAQERAIGEIIADLVKPRPMHRLLQGDVGCGKTLVAVYAALAAIANKAQVAVMAPTEILAEQLFRQFDRYLADSRVRRELLTGGRSDAERKRVVAAIAAGQLDLLVGTHALLEHDVEFARLGLVIVDEQHRFGVRHRANIRSKGAAPHYLVMTATPIPRTLAMTVFGDLDVTTIADRPPGRGPMQTRVVTEAVLARVWDFTRRRIAGGERAYVVYPLVEESEELPVRAATVEAKRLAHEVFPEVPLGVLHGRMKSAEKSKAMDDFAAGRTRVLVCTTVVEVGVDVPEATVMVIQHADRYGLSQLHQLRGRIGRGGRPGFCFLIAQDERAAQTARLNVLAQTADGFKIAEEDLRLRGPGELLGTRQHGLPEFRIADLIADADLLTLASEHARAILRGDPALASARRADLRTELQRRYGDRLAWAATG